MCVNVLSAKLLKFCRLSYLHSQKIVHRDVKTENMLLDKTRTVKIADFGVARVEASNPNDMTGETGTLGYMAPEVVISFFFNRNIGYRTPEDLAYSSCRSSSFFPFFSEVVEKKTREEMFCLGDTCHLFTSLMK